MGCKGGSADYIRKCRRPPSILEKEQDFPNEQAYHSYLEPFREKEETYTKQKLTRAIEDLTSSGLYPLAFEAPHYTMSDYGYQIASQYFTSIFGQVQLSKDNMENIRCTSVCDCSFDVARNDALSGNDRLCRHIEAKPAR